MRVYEYDREAPRRGVKCDTRSRHPGPDHDDINVAPGEGAPRAGSLKSTHEPMLAQAPK